LKEEFKPNGNWERLHSPAADISDKIKNSIHAWGRNFLAEREKGAGKRYLMAGQHAVNLSMPILPRFEDIGPSEEKFINFVDNERVVWGDKRHYEKLYLMKLSVNSALSIQKFGLNLNLMGDPAAGKSFHMDHLAQNMMIPETIDGLRHFSALAQCSGERTHTNDSNAIHIEECAKSILCDDLRPGEQGSNATPIQTTIKTTMTNGSMTFWSLDPEDRKNSVKTTKICKTTYILAHNFAISQINAAILSRTLLLNYDQQADPDASAGTADPSELQGSSDILEGVRCWVNSWTTILICHSPKRI
jgi:hypothetical protein